MATAQPQADDLQKLRELVQDIDFCMLTTIYESGDLHSRPMSANCEIDRNGDLWFFTGVSSHKVSEVTNTPKVIGTSHRRATQLRRKQEFLELKQEQ